jgi:hypothetical protein
MPPFPAVTLAVLALGNFLQTGDPVFSGPQSGEKLTTFKVHAFSGANAGKQVQLLADPKETPRVLIFVHEITRPALQFFRPIDEFAAKLAGDGLETHFVWLTADKTKTEQYLQNAKQSLALASPIVISLDGLEGPGNYGLNRKVAVTVLVAKGNKVVANFAIVQPNETDSPKVNAAVAKLMGKTPPAAPALSDKAKERPKAGANPELQQLMRKLIQLTNDDAAVKMIAGEMQKWAGENADRQAELRAYCRQIVDLNYGTEACKEALKKLAGK